MIRFHERLTPIILTPDELLLVQTIFNSAYIGWRGTLEGLPENSWKKRKALIKRIKDYLFATQGQYCAYCSLTLADYFGMKGVHAAHIDHILPKGNPKYKKFVFEPENLVLSCGRCNGFDYKGEKDYASNASTIYTQINVKIIHPYRDRFLDHIEQPENGPILVVLNNSTKGQNTLDEFELNDEVMLRKRGGYILVEENKVSDEGQIDDIVTRNYSSS